MKSPFTGGEVRLLNNDSKLTFRKEEFNYVRLIYECVDTGERFSTTHLDELNMQQVYNLYRTKYGIPFEDEIIKIRQKYNLSALKMSQILGFGDNQYRLYESGAMPSETNGKVLSAIKDINFFRTFVINSKGHFTDDSYNKIMKNMSSVNSEDPQIQLIETMIFDSIDRSIYNGFTYKSYDKVRNLILFFINKLDGVFNTKMNKLLFYSDFLSYKLFAKGISGLSYKAIQFGPVPLRWDRIYSLINDISTEIVLFPSGYSGSKLVSKIKPDLNLFSENELYVMKQVASKFKEMNASEISNLSHNEDVWNKYINSDNLLDYSEAFTLKGL